MSAYIRQYAQATNGLGNGVFSHYWEYQFPLDTLPGSTLLVIGTCSDAQAQTVQLAADPGSPLAPTGDFVNGAYTQLNIIDNTIGEQTYGSFICQNAKSVPNTANIFIVNWSGPADFNGIMIMEVVGVTANSLAGSNGKVQAVGGSGTDTANAGLAAMGSTPVFVIAMASADQNGGVPGAGTGFANVGNAFGWGGANIAMVETKHVSNPGTMTATFSPIGADTFSLLMVGLHENQGPFVAQSFSNEGTNPGATQVNGISKAFPSKTSAGNTIIGFGTVSDFAGVHTDSQFIDTANNTYVFKNQQNTNPGGGAASLWVHLAQNINGDITAPANVTMNLSTIGDVEDWQAFYAIDVGNANTTSFVGVSGNTQNGLAPGSNNINSGSITVNSDQVPCLMLAMAFNTSAAGGGSPAVGNGGMTLLSNCWSFFTSPTLATVAYRNITAPGTYSALFDQTSLASEDIAVVAIVVQGVSSVTLPTVFRMYAANGNMQANAFVQSALPSDIGLRLYANNVVHSANLVIAGDGHIRLYANGTLSVNNTIIV